MPTPDIEERLGQLVREVAQILHVDQVSPDITLLDLGIDSLSAVELTLACDQIYEGIDKEQLILTKDTTLRELDRQLLAAGLAPA